MRRQPYSSNPVGPLGAVLAVLLACGLVVGCPSRPAGGGGGGGPAGHTAGFSRGLGDAYVQAAQVHEALVQGNYDGARTLLDPMMKQLAATRGKARTDEQRQILRLEDRGLRLAGLIDMKSPDAAKAAQDLMVAVVDHQTAALAPGAKVGAPAATPSAAGKPTVTGAKAAGKPAATKPGAKPAAKATAKPTAKPHAKSAAKPGSKPHAKVAAKPAKPSAKSTQVTHTTRAAAAGWPVKPQATHRGGSDPNLARVGLAKAVVGAIHAEQALLRGRMDTALGHVKAVRGALKQAHSKGTPWQKQALSRLDKQANTLQLQLTHHNAAAFGSASQLVDASLKVQQSFKQAAAGGGGGAKKPAPAKPGAKKPRGKKPTKPAPKKPAAKKPTKPAGKKPAAHPGPAPTPFMQDVPNKPIDPTMDEDHPGALPRS